MKIVADENIPFAREAFGVFGDVVLLPGRTISPEAVRDADALVVRSVARADAALLAGSRVRFVGTATIGVDHVDLAWLASAGIDFASAPGSNAESVAQYVAAVLCRFRATLGTDLRGRTIGVVGAGHCGSRVERVARAFGMEPVLCDPPLARATDEARYRPLAELADCDFLSTHVPLTRDGADRTLGLIDAEFVARMKPGAGLIHVCRGGVADEDALLAALPGRDAGPEARRRARIGAAAIDVWVGEPRVRRDLLERADLATPHIAGYSRDGKVRGTEAIHLALCRRAGVEPSFRAEDALAAPPRRLVADPSLAPEEAVARVVLAAYDPAADDAAMRAIPSDDPAETGRGFDALRKNYPERREFAAFEALLGSESREARATLAALGFAIADR